MTIYKDKLKLIAKVAELDKNYKFSILFELIDKVGLVKEYKKLNKKSACGIDGITVKEYGKNLEGNVEKLLVRIKEMKYRPQAARRVYIPKPGKSAPRPLGLPSVGDKLVQSKLKGILEAIYEQDFLDCSHGFRPGRSCHTAIKEFNNAIMNKLINWVVEVDIKQFFDSVDHNVLYKMLKQRISDPRILGLVWRILKAGVMEDGVVKISGKGTPQGGIISPLFANIYLHYALDLWFELTFKTQAKGYVQLIRYCDDFVVVCENECDAKQFLVQLKEQLASVKLEISEDKTQILKFGRDVWKQAKLTGEKVKSFDFLGFKLYQRETETGWLTLGVKTAKKAMASKLKAWNKWLKDNRNVYAIKELWEKVKVGLIGHYNYFGVNGNMRCLRQYFNRVTMLFLKWLNRRSQKKSMNWKRYARYLQYNPLPKPRICKSIWY